MSWPYAIIMFGAIYLKQLLWHFKYILQPRTKASRPDKTRFNWRALPLPSLKRILSLALWPEYQFGKTISSCGCYFSTTSMTPVYRRDCRKKRWPSKRDNQHCPILSGKENDLNLGQWKASPYLYAHKHGIRVNAAGPMVPYTLLQLPMIMLL